MSEWQPKVLCNRSLKSFPYPWTLFSERSTILRNNSLNLDSKFQLSLSIQLKELMKLSSSTCNRLMRVIKWCSILVTTKRDRLLRSNMETLVFPITLRELKRTRLLTKQRKLSNQRILVNQRLKLLRLNLQLPILHSKKVKKILMLMFWCFILKNLLTSILMKNLKKLLLGSIKSFRFILKLR